MGNLGIGRRAGNGSEHAACLHLSEKLFRGLASNRIGDRIHWGKGVHCVVIVERDDLIAAMALSRRRRLGNQRA